MIEKNVVVPIKDGLHARPASLITRKAMDFSCDIYLIKDDGHTVDANSIMEILTMGATYNTVLTIRADGDDEHIAIDEIVNLFETDFLT